jgi:hypothetical protein
MLNNYDLGDITDEEAFAQGYKKLNPEMPNDGKIYTAKSVKENGNFLDVEWEEIAMPEDNQEVLSEDLSNE